MYVYKILFFYLCLPSYKNLHLLNCYNLNFLCILNWQDKIEQIEVEQNSQDGAISITQEELFIKVFGRRSGYVTGLGMRYSSSSKSIVGHGDNIKYVTQLEQKVQEQADQIQE